MGSVSSSTAHSSGQMRSNDGNDAGDDDGKRPAAENLPSNEAHMCYLCLDAQHESGEPLRRDCSCRGGSGWVHVSCLVGYAENRSSRSRNSADLKKAWQDCPNW